MKRLIFLLLITIYSIKLSAQTTPWSTSPTITGQTRTLSGSPQIRWLFGSNLFSLPDTLMLYKLKKDTVNAQGYARNWQLTNALSNYVPYVNSKLGLQFGPNGLNLPLSPDTVQVFGDSNIYPRQTWVNLFAGILGSTLQDFAVGGTTSQDFRNTYYASVKRITNTNRQNYRYILYGYGGTNDPVADVTISQYCANVRAAVDTMVARGWAKSQIILFNSCYVTRADRKSLIPPYADSLISIAKQKGVQYADTYTWTKNNGGQQLLQTIDSLHLTQRAGPIFARALLGFINGGINTQTITTMAGADFNGQLHVHDQIISDTLGTRNIPYKSIVGSQLPWEFGQNAGWTSTNGSPSDDRTFGFYSYQWGLTHPGIPVLSLSGVDGGAHFNGPIVSTVGNNTSIFSANSATTGYQDIAIANTSGINYIALEGNTPGAFAANSLAYASIYGAGSNTATQFMTNATIKATITPAGNFGINITDPLGRLTVNTSSNNDFEVRDGADYGGGHTGIALDSRNDVRTTRNMFNIYGTPIVLNSTFTGINYLTDPTSGNVFGANGNIYINGTITSTGLTGGSAGDFVVNNSGTLLTRTAAQTLSDIGAAPATGGSYVPATRTINGKALSANITLGLASADFANQGTITTLLHGNASGNPFFGQVVNADITNSTIDLTTKVTGLLPDVNISSASAWNAKQSVITFGTGVQTALGVNIGSSGAPILFGGAGGTPSSITLTNATGTASALNIGGNSATVTTIPTLNGDVSNLGNAITVNKISGSTTVLPSSFVTSSLTSVGTLLTTLNVLASNTTGVGYTFDATSYGGKKWGFGDGTTTNGTLSIRDITNSKDVFSITNNTGNATVLGNLSATLPALGSTATNYLTTATAGSGNISYRTAAQVASDLSASLITGTPTIVAGAGAGASPTVSVGTNGKQLQVNITLGTLPSASSVIATVTLPNALTYTPYPTYSIRNNVAVPVGFDVTASSGSTIVIQTGTIALSAGTYNINISL